MQYENLYNSVSDKHNDDIKNKVDNMINVCTLGSWNESHNFNIKNVVDAICNLKFNQKDYIYKSFSDSFTNGTDKLFKI